VFLFLALNSVADTLTSKPFPFIVRRHRLVKQNASCGQTKLEMNVHPTLQGCADEVAQGEGTYFQYGNSECIMQFTESDRCPEGFAHSTLDFYALDNMRVKAKLLKTRHECKAKGVFLGSFPSVTKCSKEVLKNGGQFFNYGNFLHKSGKCYMKKTEFEDCPEGWEPDMYDFYRFQWTLMQSARSIGESEGRLIKENVQCKSPDEYVGWFVSLEKCARAVKEKQGQFFIYGKKMKKWLCYLESTDSEECPEGFQKAHYDFYEVADVAEEFKEALTEADAGKKRNSFWR
jgi:hypothetical protein